MPANENVANARRTSELGAKRGIQPRLKRVTELGNLMIADAVRSGNYAKLTQLAGRSKRAKAFVFTTLAVMTKNRKGNYPGKRIQFAKTLAEVFPNDRKTEEIIRRLCADQEEEVRNPAIYLLIDLEKKRNGEDGILDLTRDSNQEIRKDAVGYMHFLPANERLIERLCELYSDPSMFVRHEAMRMFKNVMANIKVNFEMGAGGWTDEKRKTWDRLQTMSFIGLTRLIKRENTPISDNYGIEELEIVMGMRCSSEVMIGLSKNPDPLARINSIKILARNRELRGDIRVLGRMCEIIADKDKVVRSHGIESLYDFVGFAVNQAQGDEKILQEVQDIVSNGLKRLKNTRDPRIRHYIGLIKEKMDRVMTQKRW